MGEHLKDRGGVLVRLILLGATLLVALSFRTLKLAEIPPGIHYDEAANGILAAGIAKGEFRPLFIEAYTGKEPLFFYLAAGLVRALGTGIFALRLTSALLGTLTVAATYWLALVLFAGEGQKRAQQLALASSTLLAVSFWHLALSRIGFRAISQPLLQALSFGFLWKGLREERPALALLGGAFCGAALYTYLASRLFPLVFLPLFAVLLILGGRSRFRYAGLLLLFVLAAALVFAPLGVYFLTHPGTFWVRIAQLSPQGGKHIGFTLARSLGHAMLRMGTLVAVRGDGCPRFNLPGKPLLSWPLTLLLLLGGLYSLTRIFRSPRALERGLYLTLLAWPVIMALPSVLTENEGENLRAVGMLPAFYFLPALGLAVAIQGAGWLARRWRAAGAALWPLGLGLILAGGGMASFRDYFRAWATSPDVYYQTEADLRAIARFLEGVDAEGTAIFVASEHYRHPALAYLSPAYPRLKWLTGRQVMVLPGSPERPALYLFPHSAQPEASFLETYFPPERLVHQEKGPDGQVAFSAYLLPAGTAPQFSSPEKSPANLGGFIELVRWETSEGVEAGGEFELTLYWRVLKTPPRGDYKAFVHLLDEWGERWAQDDFFDYAPDQWEPGEVVINLRHLDLAGLAPPGKYHFEVGFYSGSTGERLPRQDQGAPSTATSISLEPIAVARPATPGQAPIGGIGSPRRAALGPYLTLLGFDQDRVQGRPEEKLHLALYWQARTKVAADYLVELVLSGEEGQGEWPLWRGRPVHDTYPTHTWRAGEAVKDLYSLTIPRRIQGGPYQLELRLLDAAGGGPVSGPEGEPSIRLGRLTVEAPRRAFSAPPLEHPLSARLGDEVEFLGYRLDKASIAPGEKLGFTLYWKALKEMRESYTVFTHLIDDQGRIWGQKDNLPVSGTYPTALWVEGEVVEDRYEFAISPEAPPGEYALEIGMYRLETGERLPVSFDAGRSDRILIKGLRVGG